MTVYVQNDLAGSNLLTVVQLLFPVSYGEPPPCLLPGNGAAATFVMKILLRPEVVRGMCLQRPIFPPDSFEGCSTD